MRFYVENLRMWRSASLLQYEIQWSFLYVYTTSVVLKRKNVLRVRAHRVHLLQYRLRMHPFQKCPTINVVFISVNKDKKKKCLPTQNRVRYVPCVCIRILCVR